MQVIAPLDAPGGRPAEFQADKTVLAVAGAIPRSLAGLITLRGPRLGLRPSAVLVRSTTPRRSSREDVDGQIPTAQAA
jgi:hypothetical protein